MSGVVDKVKSVAVTARQRTPLVEHLLAMVQHYGKVDGSILAGGVTYFAFLSFFPLLALGFAAVGFVSGIVPAVRDTLTDALVQAFPGIVARECAADQTGCISLSTFENSAGAASIIGAVGLLVVGLNWLSALQTSLADVFGIPAHERRNIVVGKAIDLAALVVLGLTLIVSVAVSSTVATLVPAVVTAIGLDGVPGMSLLFGLLGLVLGIASSTLLFLVMFRLLAADAGVDPRDRRNAAIVAGVGFEALKLVAATLVSLTLGNPAFATLGVALVLLVWMNYFSRLVLYAAAWAAVANDVHEARAERTSGAGVEELPTAALPGAVPVPAGTGLAADPAPDEVGSFVRGLGVGAAVVGAVWATARIRSPGD
ncbi:MAG: YihY/virulence factor BrkB family protein [Actinomycetota bacterium]|nr:YihY/virulence factor BrkB family protein [Actinomycetota bacterium]